MGNYNQKVRPGRIFKNVAPALAVMIAGLVGGYLVYDNYMGNSVAAQVAGTEPAAGDENATVVTPATAESEPGSVKDTGAAPKPGSVPADTTGVTTSTTDSSATMSTTTTAPDASGTSTTTTTTTMKKDTP